VTEKAYREAVVLPVDICLPIEREFTLETMGLFANTSLERGNGRNPGRTQSETGDQPGGAALETGHGPGTQTHLGQTADG